MTTPVRSTVDVEIDDAGDNEPEPDQDRYERQDRDRRRDVGDEPVLLGQLSRRSSRMPRRGPPRADQLRRRNPATNIDDPDAIAR